MGWTGRKEERKDAQESLGFLQDAAQNRASKTTDFGKKSAERGAFSTTRHFPLQPNCFFRESRLYLDISKKDLGK